MVRCDLERGLKNRKPAQLTANGCRQLQRMTAAQRKNQHVSTYRQLLTITQTVLANARRTVEATKTSCGKTTTDALTIEALRKEITGYCELGDRVLDQARRRVMDDEQVPVSEKIFPFQTRRSL